MRCLFVKKIFWLPGRGPVPRRRFNGVIFLWMEFFQFWDDDGVGCSNPAFLYEVLYEDEEGYEPERVSKNRFRAICGREKRCRSLKRGRSLRRKAELLLLSVGFWSGWLFYYCPVVIWLFLTSWKAWKNRPKFRRKFSLRIFVLFI